MEDYLLLLVLSLAMFIGSYVAGALPLIVSFTESKLRLVTVIGAGLLVGTALAVIIPEGVQSIYTAQSKTENLALSSEFENTDQKVVNIDDKNKFNNNHLLNVSPTSNKFLRHVINNQSKSTISAAVRAPGQQLPAEKDHSYKRVKKHAIPSDHEHDSNDPGDIVGNIDEKSNLHNKGGHSGERERHHRHDHDHLPRPHVHQGVDVHNAVGLALVAGFVLMLLIDQLAQNRSSRIDAQSGILIQQPRYKITATIGLVVHAAADGVALGAASGSSHTDVQFIVFFAIMLHKAPASFGLVTFLLHEGLDKGRVRKHLLIFALAAPLAALATFFCITKGGPESLTSLHSTGVLLLFSAGTFLYVATVHVLPEVTGSGGHAHGSPISGQGGGGGFKLNELIALVIGAIAPTLLTVGHSH